nr:MAG TPA: hypothetical protein [Caudoviricetes sp.]
MKVSELQIGDWVICLGDPVRVVSLSLKDDEPIGIMSPLKTIETFKEEDVKPVPLTEAIFDNACEQDDRKYVEWYFSEDKTGIWHFEITEVPDCFRIYIKYVHELQHALRLVGLSEQAKNLKV